MDHLCKTLEEAKHVPYAQSGSISWSDRVTNETVLSRAGCVSVVQSLKICRLRWLGHIRRMPDDELPKDIYCILGSAMV